ncbi:GAF domain-containing protein [Thalassomonas haliotis]|uniref:GAF domain-containing protein n=1 Tax=Thalassomonas haliotis TaxID=485448 RepID=A0ABY7VIG8_9GAMM|nr:GAF domain-containing protein [Thalassomonas haliotis]WDE13162.1 GAF domain-containing protein [Thalassomonas haliotis]
MDAQQQQIRQLEKTIKRLTISRQLLQEFISNVKGVKQLVAIVFDRVLEALDAESGSLWLVDKAKKQNVCHLAKGTAKNRVIGLRLPFGVGVVGAVVENQQPELIMDCGKDPRFNADVDKNTGFVTHSMICVPLTVSNESYGAIQVINKKSGVNHRFDEEDCELVKELAVAASLSMRNARLLEVESLVKEMHILMTISKEVVATLDIEQVLDYVVNKTNELVEITGAAIALWDENRKLLKLRVLSGGEAIDIKQEKQQEQLALMEQIRTLGRSSYVADRLSYKKSLKGSANAWLNYLEKHGLNAFWAVPLEDDEGILGVLWFESDKSHFASQGKTDLLHILATQATVALRNASLFKSIPFSATLSNIGQKGQKMLATGKKKSLTLILASILLLEVLHYAPFFRFVSGQTLVEARLGVGAFLPVAGRVENILVKEGQTVKAGDIIAKLDPALPRLTLLEAEAKLAILDRQIIEARAESDAALMSKSAIERAAVNAQVVKARYDLEQINIRAPIDGIVLTPRPQELTGRYFALGEEIMRFVNPENLLVIVHIPETDLTDIEVGQRVKGVLRSQPGEYFTGIVRHIGQAYETPNTLLESSSELESEETNTGFIAEVEIAHAPYQLRPGMTGQAIITTPKTSALVKIWRRISNFFAFNFGW